MFVPYTNVIQIYSILHHIPLFHCIYMCFWTCYNLNEVHSTATLFLLLELYSAVSNWDSYYFATFQALTLTSKDSIDTVSPPSPCSNLSRVNWEGLGDNLQRSGGEYTCSEREGLHNSNDVLPTRKACSERKQQLCWFHSSTEGVLWWLSSVPEAEHL